MNTLAALAGKRVSLPDTLAGNWQGIRELLFNLINILDARHRLIYLQRPQQPDTTSRSCRF
jgi:hypothetical protein